MSYSTILEINEKYAKAGLKPIPFFQNTNNQSFFYELMQPKVKIVVNSKWSKLNGKRCKNSHQVYHIYTDSIVLLPCSDRSVCKQSGLVPFNDVSLFLFCVIKASIQGHKIQEDFIATELQTGKKSGQDPKLLQGGASQVENLMGKSHLDCCN